MSTRSTGSYPSGAPIDGFGVGTAMGVSADAPYLDIVYKLTSYAGEGRVKLATDKPVLPGRKQVFRMSDADRDTGDTIATRRRRPAGPPAARTSNARRQAAHLANP